MVSSERRVGEKAAIVGIHTIARMLGLSRPATHELVSAGIIKRRSFGKYDAIEVATDYIAHLRKQLVAAREGNADFQTSRAGLIEEKRRIAEIEREKLEGELIHVTAVEDLIDRVATTMRDAIMGLGPKYAPALAGMRGDVRRIAIFLEDAGAKILGDMAAGFKLHRQQIGEQAEQ
jgi:hypothetical protein